LDFSLGSVVDISKFDIPSCHTTPSLSLHPCNSNLSIPLVISPSFIISTITQFKAVH
jgi:hypothetical protein